MTLDLQNIVRQAQEAFEAAQDAATLENVKAQFLGKSGQLTELMKGLAKADPAEKKALGGLLNQAKQEIEALLLARRDGLAQALLNQRLQAEAIDVTLPGRGRELGGIHPISHVLARIESIFGGLGFAVADGPEVENDWYNFTALNNPLDHPARSMQDTFYLDKKDQGGLPLLLRTHTSPMQIRYACHHALPLKVIAPGRVYRVDSDATHSPMFHQVEGLWLDKTISFADLKGTIIGFLRTFFEADDLNVRFRPSFFPFTEPSAEIDMQFASGPNQGKWLEIGGCGQVHPSVVKNFGLDPELTTGFAFGLGADRLTMLRYGINDLRLFYDGDLRFLRQFK